MKKKPVLNAVWWTDPDAMCSSKPLCHFPSSAGQGRKKGLWVKIGMGRDHSPVTIKGKTDLMK